MNSRHDGMESLVAANLLDHNVDLIAILHVEFLGGLSLVEALAVKEETDIRGG